MNNNNSNPRTRSTSHPNDFPIVKDEPVVARDGVYLGFVADVLSGHFAVRPQDGGEYWLSRATIAEPRVGQVLLAFDSQQVAQFRQEAPIAGAEDPVLDAGIEAFESEEDVIETRERMQRGYEAKPARANRSN